jgi:sugar phosphate isomerase/epimerase
LRILCSTGAVTRRPNRADPALVADAGTLPVEAFELSVYPGWCDTLADVEGTAATLRATGLVFAVAHADKTIGADLSHGEPSGLARLDANVRLAAAVGAGLVVLHLWELPVGDRELHRNLDLLPACLDLAEEADVVLAVETIPCTSGSPLANVARAVDRDDRCRITLDTEFLALHGELGAAPGAGLPVAHVHVKDFDGEIRHGDPRFRYLLPGEGSLDLDGFLDELRASGYGGGVALEASAVDPDGRLDRARLAEIAEALRRLDSAHGD